MNVTPKNTAQQRDRAFRAYFDKFTLHPDDRADLHRRGLSDAQIERWGVVSIESKEPGYVCPCFMPSGEVVGAQWRVRDAGDGARYKWISWVGGSQYEGALPLTCYRPSGVASGVAVVESMGAKAVLLAERSGLITIGAGSSTQFGDPTHWANWLGPICAELDTKTLRFYPDAGSVKNPHVHRQYSKFFAHAAELGYEVVVAWWGHVDKSAGDIDELAIMDDVRFITVQDFEAIIARESSVRVPLVQCLATEHRRYIDAGIGSGGRDNAGAAIARDLVGTEQYLRNMGVDFDGDAQSLIRQYCDRCTPPMSAADADRLYQSALKSSPSPCLSPDKIDACIKAYSSKAPLLASGEVLAPTKKSKKITAEFMVAVDEVVVSIADRSAKLVEIGKLAQVHGYGGNVAGLLDLRAAEIEAREASQGLADKIRKDLRNSRYAVDLDKIYTGDGGAKFAQYCNWVGQKLGSHPMAMVAGFLTASASVCQVGTKLWLGDTHDAKPIIQTMIVGPSGTAKSPSLNAVMGGLIRLESEAQEAYQKAMADYELAMKKYRKSLKNPDNEMDEPEEPVRPRAYSVQDFTMEALAEICASQPMRGFAIYYDELAGLFGGMNQYKGGNGSDSQQMLMIDGGTAINSARKGKARIYVPQTSISITGTIQPTVLSKLIVKSNADGQWARFLPVILDGNKSPQLPEMRRLPDYNGWFADIYRRIDGYEPKEYVMDDAAFATYRAYWGALESRRLLCGPEEQQSVISKARNKVGRIALVLHLQKAALNGTVPADEIDLATMEGAIEIMNFFLNQWFQLMASGDLALGEVSEICKKIYSYVLRRPDSIATWMDVSRGVNALRGEDERGNKLGGKANVLAAFKMLAENGLGEIVNGGMFRAFPTDGDDRAPEVPTEIIEPPTLEVVEYGEPAPPPQAKAPTPAADVVDGEVIKVGDRVIILNGDHQWAEPLVVSIDGDSYTVASDYGSAADFAAVINRNDLIKHTVRRMMEVRMHDVMPAKSQLLKC